MATVLSPAAARELRSAPLTYLHVGATEGALPAGYHHQRLSEPVGRGASQFGAAAQCLLTWRMHEQAGLTAEVSDRVVQEGSVAILRLHLGPVRLRVPVRVVRLVEEPGRRGFAYGTLPGHPERGEEQFLVRLADDGTVFFDLVAFSRAARWFTLLGRPVAQAGQHLITRRYLNAVRRAAQSVRERETR